MARYTRTVWWVGLAVSALAVATPLVAAGQAASYYTWRDASGTVHVTATPPPGRKVQVLKVDEPGHSPVASTPAPKTLPSTEASDDLKQAQAAYRRQSCAAAHSDLALLGRQRMVVTGDAVSAATKLDEAQREQAKVRARQRVAQFCGSK